MNNNLNYSPKLKTAMEEIKEIMNKHDIGGIVIIHTPGFGEHYTKINPSYSALELKQREGILMKGRNNEKFKGDSKKHLKAIENSLNLLKIICDLAGRTILPLINASEMLDKYYDASHDKGKHSGHDEVFN